MIAIEREEPDAGAVVLITDVGADVELEEPGKLGDGWEEAGADARHVEGDDAEVGLTVEGVEVEGVWDFFAELGGVDFPVSKEEILPVLKHDGRSGGARVGIEFQGERLLLGGKIFLVGRVNVEGGVFVVGFLFGMTPDDTGPGGIGFVSGNEVDVELRDEVADGGDVDFMRGEFFFDEVGHLPDGEHDGGKVVGVEMVELGEVFRDFGDENEPGEKGVVFEEDSASSEGAEVESASGETGVELEGHRVGLKSELLDDGDGLKMPR